MQTPLYWMWKKSSLLKKLINICVFTIVLKKKSIRFVKIFQVPVLDGVIRELYIRIYKSIYKIIYKSMYKRIYKLYIRDIY